MENKQINMVSNDELSLKEIILIVKDWWKYLLSKWLIILICGLVGGGLGIVYSLVKKPKYTAHLSFALVEGGGGFSGIESLASSLGFSALLNGNTGAFSGDNLLEILRSKYAIQKTLLSPVLYNGEQKTLVDVYIDFHKMRDAWKNNKNQLLRDLSYPIGQDRETYNRVQDSVLNDIYKLVSSPKVLTIARKNKMLNVVNVKFTDKNEVFAKFFVETLMNETSRFYSETRTAQIRANVAMMQHTADSIKSLYEATLYRGAGYAGVNVNPAVQYAAIPRIKEETNAKLFGTVYTEVLKNLETLKLDLARETPLVQIIDTPRYPLEMKRFGKAKGLIFGGFLGGLLIVFFLLIKKYFTELIE